jgi:hypothetical protein
MVAIFASALNLSSEDVDNAFIEAVTMWGKLWQLQQ